MLSTLVLMIVINCSVENPSDCEVIATKEYEDIINCAVESVRLGAEIFKLSDKEHKVYIKCRKVEELET